MNKPYNLQNIWATTDKSVIDVMTRKIHPAPSTTTTNDCDDNNSDLESLYGPFVAVPKEFRPPLSVRTKIEPSQMSLNENKELLSNKHPISNSKNIAEKTIRKNPLLETPKNAVGKTIPNYPLLEDTKFETGERKRNARQIGAQVLKRSENTANDRKYLQNGHQDTDDASTAQRNTGEQKYPGANRKAYHAPKKMANNPFQKYHRKVPRQENGNKEVKYEYIERRGTVKLNFEMPTKFNDGLKMDPKEEIRNKEKQEIKPNPHTFLYQENKVKWVSSLNLHEQASDVEDKTGRDFGKVRHKISFQKNMLKWDSNLNGLNRDTTDKIERDLSKEAHRVFQQKNTVKWDSSLNHRDSSTDTEGEIEWTIIQEKKTIVSAKKIEGKSHINNQFNDEHLPTRNCQTNIRGKWHRKKNFNNNRFKQPKNFHRNSAPKPNQKDTGRSVYKNDLQLNSNLQKEHMHVQNSKKLQERSMKELDNFSRQCRISKQNVDSYDDSPNLSNNRHEFTINFHANKNGDNAKSDSCFEKIDNTALNHLEEQKQSLLDYGREMSDLIIGSHTALSLFISTFREWKRSRLELIVQFEELEKTMKECSKKFTKYRDVLNFAKTGATLAAAVPLPHVSIAARVISVLTGLFSAFLSTTESKMSEVENSNDISLAAVRDTSASYDLYTHGLQCGLQFEDTTKAIAEFHLNAADPVIFEKESPEVAAFIRGVLEYKPTHRVFFKKIHTCFQELLRNCRSEFGKRLCEPFLLYSADAVDIVEFLNWRFLHEDFNGESVRFELQQIERLIQNSDTSVKELAGRLVNCIGILQDELKFLERCVKDLNLFEKSV